MEPSDDVYAMVSGDDPVFGSKSDLSRNHDLGPVISDPNKDGFVYLWLQSLRLEGDGDGGKDSGEEENTDKNTGERNSKYGWDFVGEQVISGGFAGEGGWGGMWKKDRYPQRPDAKDCAFYLKTGFCKYGSTCKFNHPARTTFQYYSNIGSCKFGRACRYNHMRPRRSGNSVVKLNIVGLPVRPHEKECGYYMRTGFCKYGACCKFDHPEPTASVQSASPKLGNEGSRSLHDSFESANRSWCSSTTETETVLSVPVALLDPSERRMLQLKGYVMNSPTRKTHLHRRQYKQTQTEEFPQRPGRPECNYFVRTGDCWFKHTCKYHHPRSLRRMSTPCMFNEDGLPLRPDESLCVYYILYGICKFGPACQFDHPIELAAWNRD